MTATLFGIPNCDTVRKARKWLEASGIDHQFIDFRETPTPPDQLRSWLAQVGAPLLNKRSTTWKQLTDSERQAAEQYGDALIALLGAHPTLIKRPVLEHEGRVRVGFSASDYANEFGA